MEIERMKLPTKILNVLTLTATSLTLFSFYSLDLQGAGAVRGEPSSGGSASVAVCGATEEFDLEEIKDAVVGGAEDGAQTNSVNLPASDNRSRCRKNCDAKLTAETSANEILKVQSLSGCHSNYYSRLEALVPPTLPWQCSDLTGRSLSNCLTTFCQNNAERPVCSILEDAKSRYRTCEVEAYDHWYDKKQEIEASHRKCLKKCSALAATALSAQQIIELTELLEVVGYSDKEINDYINYLTAPQTGCSATKVPTKIGGEFSN